MNVSLGQMHTATRWVEVKRDCSVLERVNVFHMYGAGNFRRVDVQGDTKNGNF